MEWPVCSPDMNPIEHVWNALGKRVAGRQLPPQTLQELEKALLEEWNRIPQLVINSLIELHASKTYRPPPRSERYGSCSVWQQWITEGRVYRRGGSGRPRNTNDREDRAIRRVATSAPTTSLASIQRHLPPSRHPVPSRETIRRRLTEVGLRSRRPLRRLPLTPHHRQCRLDFCRPRATWSVTDWRRVIFSEESRFSLSADDHRTRVWRRTGQRSDPAFIVERHTAISQGVTVWEQFLGTHDHL
ncbi:HTH_Tnp_Tc3_2 domain-containing protein [Trichonephila clavipes]|nr:HTH_Tnp_Tc3_2 domain-containing protein [Trichonephila clavipes]